MDTILSDLLADEITCVRDTGGTDMSDISTVMRSADELELYHLAAWLGDKENHKAYMNFMITGRWD
ncbi:MAG: DUF5049 domain-containing protein [Clostridiaceae bacterium]|nr:DUF5049 domain-containing protein [Clostridiaceae bacterium]